MVTGERTWRLMDPDGQELVLCSAACVITWLCAVGVFEDAGARLAAPGAREGVAA